LKIFICGPTLYEKCHIGHARIFIFFNFLINYQRFIGNSPIAIMQLTDIDHKIYQKVDYKGLENLKIPDIYLSCLLRDLENIQIEKNFIYGRVSDFLSIIKNEVIDILKSTKGYSYAGNVFLKIDEDLDSPLGLTLDEIKNMPIDISCGKRSQRDIMIWNSENFYKDYSKKIDNIIASGIPGWHFQDYETIKNAFNGGYDIHGGAKELLYPHHEFIAEISKERDKNVPLYRKRRWIHVGLLNINSEKMSNSTGNTISISTILKKCSPNALKIFFLSKNYKKDINFTSRDLDKATEIDQVIGSVFLECENRGHQQNVNLEQQFLKKFLRFLNDDYDTESSIKLILEIIGKYQNPKLIKRMVEILGLRYY
jgi:cysteinyl-tRNA synthetase